MRVGDTVERGATSRETCGRGLVWKELMGALAVCEPDPLRAGDFFARRRGWIIEKEGQVDRNPVCALTAERLGRYDKLLDELSGRGGESVALRVFRGRFAVLETPVRTKSAGDDDMASWGRRRCMLLIGRQEVGPRGRVLPDHEIGDENACLLFRNVCAELWRIVLVNGICEVEGYQDHAVSDGLAVNQLGPHLHPGRQ